MRRAEKRSCCCTRRCGFAVAMLALGVGVMAGGRVGAEVTLAPIFRDGAVLQREKPVPVWGTAAPDERVRVRFADQDVTSVADAAGRWRVTLAPLKASATPAELSVEGTNRLRVSDVLVGEVWLCAGQSNMAFRLSRATGAKEDLAAANYPLIRQFDVPVTVGNPAQTPTIGRWSHTTPEVAKYFTALGYHFALEIHRALGVPVGFIRAAAGGTAIEAWLSDAAVRDGAEFALVRERWQRAQADDAARRAAHAKALASWQAEAAAAKASGRAFTTKQPATPPAIAHNEPGVLFRTMIAPLAPYAMRGMLWYQGESNHTRPGEYAALFRGMIQQWRGEFGQGELPFYFVQLPNYEQPSDRTGKLWALLREAQASALDLPNTAMVVGIDVGDAKDLHPPNKPELARRLARIARVNLYGEAGPAESPRAVAFEPHDGTVRVRLSHAAGLHVRGKAAGIEVAGADRVFHPATLVIDGDTVIARAAAVPQPVAVRYAWANAPDVSLYNGAGLPAAPFRSDDW